MKTKIAVNRWERERDAYGGEAADAEAARRRRDLDDLEGVLVLLLPVPLPLPLPLPVPPVLVLPAHHRESWLQIGEAAAAAEISLLQS